MKKTPTRKKQLVFLILPASSLLDFAGASQVFQEAIEQGLDAEIKYCTYEKNLRSSSQLPLGNIEHYSFLQPGDGDVVFIVSAHSSYSLSPKMNPNKELLHWIITSHQKGATVCAICTGAFLLGKTGLLDNRNCTSHWRMTQKLQEKFPLARVHENILFIEDARIITSAGATSGIDVALHLLCQMKGEHFTYNISRELVIYNRRSGSHEQQSIFLSHRNHLHQAIHKIQDWLVENLSNKKSIADLAEMANMSERNFTRVFKKETGVTVNDYITSLRKEKIKHLIKSKDLSRKQIAHLCGIKSIRHLSRLMD